MTAKLAAGLLAACVTVSCVPAWADSGPDRWPAPGDEITREIAAGDRHRYRLDIESGRFLYAVVEQSGIDLVVSTSGPSGAELINFDSPNNHQGPEPVYVLAGEGGAYGFEVSAFDAHGRGKYTLRTVELRNGEPDDRRRMDAERSFGEGRRLREERTADSRRQAIGHFEVALGAFRELADPAREGDTLTYLGGLHQALREPRRALHYYSPAIDLLELTGQERRAAITWIGVGWCHDNLGAFQRALDAYQEALWRLQALGSKTGQATALASIGLAHHALGDYAGALARHRQAVALWRETGVRSGEAMALRDIGLAQEAGGDSERAREHFEQALTMFRELGRRKREAESVLDLARLDRKAGNADEAAARLPVAARIFEEIGDTRGAARTLHEQARLEALRDDVEGAVATLRHALRASRAAEDRAVEAEALHMIARMEHRRGDHHAALNALDSALERVEALRAGVAGDDLRSQFLASRQEWFDFHVELLLELDRQRPGAGWSERALLSAERGRARAFAEGIARAQEAPGVSLDAEQARRRAAIEARTADLRDRLARTPGAADRRSIMESIADEEARLSDLLQLGKSVSSGGDGPPASVAAIAALIEPESALLYFEQTGSRWVAFVLTRDAFHVVPVEAPDLTERARNFIELVATGDDGWKPVGRRLGQTLLEPCLSRLPETIRSLVLVPDGILHYLPFEALIVGEQPLIERYVVSYTPSAAALATLRRNPRRHEASEVAVFADPVLPGASRSSQARESQRGWALYEDEGFEVAPLPFSAREAKAVRRRAAGATFTGARATERTLRDGVVNEAGVLHFATHGLISRWSPLRSALVLSADADGDDDGLLQAREIGELRLNTDLVVLSACETARGRLLAGEGVQGLVRAFFYAGARSVVASLWSVNDRRTSTLMDRFYAHLSSGLPKAEALREAKRDLLRDPATSSPRHWAAFVLVGDGNGVLGLRPAPSRLFGPGLLGMGATALLVIAIMMLRRGIR